MDEMLTWAEIEERFPDEWVAIADPEITAEIKIICGRVVHHGPDRDEAESALRCLGLKSTAVIFLGAAVPDGMIAIL